MGCRSAPTDSGRAAGLIGLRQRRRIEVGAGSALWTGEAFFTSAIQGIFAMARAFARGGRRQNRAAARRRLARASQGPPAAARAWPARSRRACRPRSWSGCRTLVRGPSRQPLETATVRCFSARGRRSRIERFRADRDPFLEVLGASGDDKRGGGVQEGDIRVKGLGIPSSTLCKAIALASASPPFSASPATRDRPASSGVTSKVRIIAVLECGDKGFVAGEGDFVEAVGKPCTTQTDLRAEVFQHTTGQRLHPLPRKTRRPFCRVTPAGLDSGPRRLKIVRVASSARVGPTFFIMAGWCGWREHEADATGFMDAAADLLGLDVDLDPERRQRTSAAPEAATTAPGCRAWRRERPAPATMNEAQVETLTEPEPSPPVPTTSMASAGAVTRSILARLADTAPVISSTVSPRTPKRHQQAAHLRGRGLAGHQAVEGGRRLLARQCGAGGDLSDDRFEIVHRVPSN